MADYTQLFGELGGAVQDFFASQGAAKEQKSFERAAAIANQNAQISAQAARIKETQTNRDVFRSLGATRAGIAGAGFKAGGSGADILASSVQQGELSKALIAAQGAINVNAFESQAQAYQSQAKAAGNTSQSELAAGAASAATGAFGLLDKVTGGVSNLFGGSSASDVAPSLLPNSEFDVGAQSIDQLSQPLTDTGGGFLSDIGDFLGNLF